MNRLLKKKMTLGITAGLMAGAIGVSSAASAAPGDPAVWEGGVKISQGFSNVFDMAVMGNGSIFLASDNQSNSTVRIKRYDSTGELKRTIDVSDPESAISVQATAATKNRVYVLMQGSARPHSFVQRFTAKGDIDTAWGGDGEVELDMISGEDSIAAITVLPDGGLAVAAGFKVYVLDADGTLDESFSGNGIAQVPRPTQSQVMGIAAGENGALYFVGPRYDTNNTFVSKMTASGSVASRFGRKGVAKSGVAGAFRTTATTIEIDSEGRVVVGGIVLNSEGSRVRLAAGRLLRNGRTDTSFSGDGWATYTVGTKDMLGGSIAVQADDKVVLAGGTDLTWTLLRLNEDGSRDSAFGEDGKVALEAGERETAIVTAIHIDESNGHIVMAGIAPLEDAEDGIGLGAVSMS